MKARFMFWTGIQPHGVPIQDILGFNEEAPDLIEEAGEMLKDAVAAGVGEAIDNIDFK